MKYRNYTQKISKTQSTIALLNNIYQFDTNKTYQKNKIEDINGVKASIVAEALKCGCTDRQATLVANGIVEKF